MIDVEELDDEHEARNDFRRANGSPLVSDPVDPSKNQRYRRPSGYGKPLDDDSNLTNWRIKVAMKGVASSKALQAKILAAKDSDKPEWKALADEAADKGKANEASDTGTALHAMTQRVEDPDDLFDMPEQYEDSLKAYVRKLEEFGLVSEYVEVHMVNDAYRAAGTADRIYRTTRPLKAPDDTIIPADSLILADVKTGKKLDFSLPGYCVQLAIYADGMLYDIHKEERLPTPPINPNWALLVHMPADQPGKCELLWVSIALGLHGAWLSFEVKDWQNKWKNGTHDCHLAEPPEDDAEPVVVEPEPANELPAEVSLVAMVEYIKLRMAVIKDSPLAKKELAMIWPEKLPMPKHLVEKADIVKTLNLLDRIEAKYSLPLLHSDPRVALSSGYKPGPLSNDLSDLPTTNNTAKAATTS